MVTFVLLLINFFLILFQYIYKFVYILFVLITNNIFFKKLKSYLILDLNFFSTEWLFYGDFVSRRSGEDFNQLTFFKKYLLSVFPDINSRGYNFKNQYVVNLKSYRNVTFPILDEVAENNFYVLHKNSLKDFNKIGNFLLKSKFSNDSFKAFMSNKHNNSILYNSFHFIFFLENNFYYLLTNMHFVEISKRNFSKFNFIFLTLLKKFSKKVLIKRYDLNNVNDWFSFNVDKLNLIKSAKKGDSEFSLNGYKVFSKFDNLFHYYNNILPRVIGLNEKINSGSKIFLSDVIYNFKELSNSIFNVNRNLKTNFKVNFSESSTNKFIDVSGNFNRNNYVFFFLRKNKIFNKGRYSRNRQTYRTGFYWCLWVNIFAIYGLHWLCYRFTFAFGYLWVPFIIFFGSFVFGRMLKYNFHNLNFISLELVNFSNWVGFFLKNVYDFLKNLNLKLLKSLRFLRLFTKNNKLNTPFTSVWNLLVTVYLGFRKNSNSLEHTHVWYYLSSKDESFFQSSSFFFFLNQFFFKK